MGRDILSLHSLIRWVLHCKHHFKELLIAIVGTMFSAILRVTVIPCKLKLSFNSSLWNPKVCLKHSC